MGGGGVVDTTVTATCPPIGALDGFVDETGFVAATGFLGIMVGDNAQGHTAQGFLTFDLSALVPGAVIDAATLEVGQYAISGAPYADLGSIWLDHVELGGTLVAADWGNTALDGNFALLSSTSALGTLRADVKDQVQADVHAGRTRSSFRLGFTALTDGDGVMDVAHLQDAEDAAGSGVLPTLIVRFAGPP
jgi:hypothetical protein